MEPRSEKGLKFFSWGIFSYTFGAVVTFVWYLTWLYFGSTGWTSSDGFSPNHGALFADIVLSSVGRFLLLLALITGLVGLFEMRSGKNEFGPKHSKNVSAAFFLLVAFGVLAFSSYMIQFFGSIGSLTQPLASQVGTIVAIVSLSAVLDVVAYVLLGIGVVYLVYELCNRKYKRILGIALVLIVAIAVAVASLLIIDQLQQLEACTSTGCSWSSSPISLNVAWNFVAFALIYLCYRHAYRRVKTGIIQPSERPLLWPQMTLPPTTVPSRPTGTVEGCSACGTPVSKEDTFCANCGARLR
jgi:hypothetical protein